MGPRTLFHLGRFEEALCAFRNSREIETARGQEGTGTRFSLGITGLRDKEVSVSSIKGIAAVCGIVGDKEAVASAFKVLGEIESFNLLQTPRPDFFMTKVEKEALSVAREMIQN